MMAIHNVVVVISTLQIGLANCSFQPHTFAKSSFFGKVRLFFGIAQREDACYQKKKSKFSVEYYCPPNLR